MLDNVGMFPHFFGENICGDLVLCVVETAKRSVAFSQALPSPVGFFGDGHQW